MGKHDGHTAVAKVLIESGRLNLFADSYALQYACHYEQIAIVQTMLTYMVTHNVSMTDQEFQYLCSDTNDEIKTLLKDYYEKMKNSELKTSCCCIM